MIIPLLHNSNSGLFPTNIHHGDEQSIILVDCMNSSGFESFCSSISYPFQLGYVVCSKWLACVKPAEPSEALYMAADLLETTCCAKRKVWLDYWKTRGQVERYPGEREVTLTFHPEQSSELNVTAWVTSPPTEQKNHLMKQSDHRTMANDKRILFQTTEAGMQMVK